MTNMLLGWTVLGWVLALMWASTDRRPAAQSQDRSRRWLQQQVFTAAAGTGRSVVIPAFEEELYSARWNAWSRQEEVWEVTAKKREQ
jgi:hypothetical protein